MSPSYANENAGVDRLGTTVSGTPSSSTAGTSSPASASAQRATITTELNKALEGRENRVKSLLGELDTFMGGLDGQRKEIVRALEGVDRLAKRLAGEKKTIATTLDTMPDALKVLADQRRNLTAMLTSLSKLGTAGTKVVNASRADLVANLRNLQPILAQLNKAGSDLPNALELLTGASAPRRQRFWRRCGGRWNVPRRCAAVPVLARASPVRRPERESRPPTIPGAS